MATIKSKRGRKRAPSKAEWDRILKHWHQLYICQKLPLPEVKARLAKEHNFEAGLSMFKTRMKQLGSRKNFKKEELAAVAQILEIFVQAGLRTPTAVVDGQPVPIQRVKRHFNSLFAHNTLQNSTTAGPSLSTTCLRITISSQDRNKEPKSDHARRLMAMPRIFLKQSEDMHDLELALIQVNNYYDWRLKQSDDYFQLQMINTGHYADSNRLNTVAFFNTIPDLIITLRKGLLSASQAAVKLLRSQAPGIIQQQHTIFLETLLRSSLQSSYVDASARAIYSYLFSLSRSLLPKGHPISMTLKMLQSPETKRMSELLLLNVLCDVARRQEYGSGLVLELEFDIAVSVTRRVDFYTASECWHRLLQRAVDEFGEKSEFCRSVLYRIGYHHYMHYFNDKARKLLLQVLELDDAYVQGGNEFSKATLNAALGLGRICEDAQDLSGAEEWYLQAYDIAYHKYGPGDNATIIILDQLDLVRAKLGEGENTPGFDGADVEDVLEELQVEITRLQLQEAEEFDKSKLRDEPWNEWDKDILDEKDDTNSLDGGTMEVATLTSKTIDEDDAQNSKTAESTESFHNPSPDTGLIWDLTNDPGPWTEHEPSKYSGSLPGLPQDGISEVFREKGEGLTSAALTHACGLGDEAQAAFMPEECTFPPPWSSGGQDSITISPYIETLPALNNDPEFQQFDHAGIALDDFDVGPMIPDTDGDFSTFDCGFFNDCDLQASIASEEQGLLEVQGFFAL